MDERQIELLTERLVERINQSNTYFLINLGKMIKQIKQLTPTEAERLVQILKYGGNYNEIIRQLEKYSNLTKKDIDEIFHLYAEQDTNFYEKFYRYRNIPFTRYKDNKIIQQQVQEFANILKDELTGLARSNMIGYTIRDLNNNVQFLGLKQTYDRVLDEAILNIRQGKDTYDSAMSKIMEQIGGSGLKKIEYESGRAVRMDSIARMNLKGALRDIHNQNQIEFGNQFGANGVEITVHEYPAPDHENVQGHRFRLEEFEKFQNNQDCVDENGIEFPAISEETGQDRRSIGQYNCYHYIYPVILELEPPKYSEKQLNDIIDNNHKKIKIDGKKYTKYECTQLQRKLETEIRKQKDIQIFAKNGNNLELVDKLQKKISTLLNKYKQLSDASGIPTKIERLQVNNYKKVDIQS